MATINGFERGNGTTDKYNYEALENKPTIPAVDDTLATTGAAADAKKTGDEIENLKSAISDKLDADDFHAVLVEETSGNSSISQVTLTNTENISSFYAEMPSSVSSYGFSKVSLQDGVATCVGGNGSQTSPYLLYTKSWGTKKWICGFKYKFTKLDSNLGDPENVRIYLGGPSSTPYDSQIAWGEWVTFAQVTTVDLTRIRISIRNFESAPASDKFTVQIKELYLYDATDIDDDTCAYIMSQQASNYQDGTVTYGDAPSSSEYVPDTTLAESGKCADAKAVGDAISEIDEAVEGISDSISQLLETVSATLTNSENITAFYNAAGSSPAFSRSISSDVAKFVISGSSNTEKSPYLSHSCSLGSKKWLVGFKYKFTKLDQNLGNPENVRIHLGQTQYYDSSISWGDWIDFSEIVETDLTRIRIAARNFTSAPQANQMQLEVKEMYAYDLAGVDSRLYGYIKTQQLSAYQDGQVTYSETVLSDVLTLSFGRINVKSHGVKGDGTTDDTDAINAMFASQKGNFYFPSGTYKISGTISLPQDSTIEGDGDTTIIDMYSCDNLTECVFRASDKVYPYILINHKNCAIKNIKLIGNNTLEQKRHAGIAVMDTSNCTIENCTIYNVNFDEDQDLTATVSGYGICVTRSQYVNVERVNSQRCGYECIGIVDACNHCVVKDCYTQDGWRTCIQVHRGSCNTLIENCYMKQTHTKYDACFTVHGLENDDLIINLRVINCTMECTQNGAQPYSYNAPAQIMSYCDGLVFIGNRVLGGKRAFYITSNSTNAKIMGNDFQCNEDSDYGITVQSPLSIVVGNCLVNEAANPVNVFSNNPVLANNIGIS